MIDLTTLEGADTAGKVRALIDHLVDDQGKLELRLDEIGLPPGAIVEPRATLSDALNELITARYAVTLVVDDKGAFQGVVDIDQINEAIRAMRASAVTEARAGLGGET